MIHVRKSLVFDVEVTTAWSKWSGTRFCWVRFGEFPRLVGRYCIYLLPKQDGGTSQIYVNKTLCQTTGLTLYFLTRALLLISGTVSITDCQPFWHFPQKQFNMRLRIMLLSAFMVFVLVGKTYATKGQGKGSLTICGPNQDCSEIEGKGPRGFKVCF